MKNALLLALIAAGLAVTSCKSTDMVAGTEIRPSRVDILRNASASPGMKVPVSKSFGEIGCALVTRMDATHFLVATLHRNQVTDFAGRLDSLEVPVIAGRPSRGFVEVVSATFTPSQGSKPITVHCLAPSSIAQRTFEETIAKQGQKLIALNGIQWSSVEDSRGASGFVASETLLASLRNKRNAVRVDNSPSAYTRLDEAGRRAFTVECGPGTQWACGEPVLTGITVTASPNNPIVIDLWMLRRNQRIYSLSDIAYFDYYGGPDCSNASDVWLSLNQLYERYLASANDIEAATNQVAALTCDQSLAQNGYSLCVDLFIQTEKAGVIMAGDNRGFDPNAPVTASRAQIYINPQTCAAGPYVNTSRQPGFGPFEDPIHAPHKLNKVSANFESGVCVVRWKLLNGYCDGAVPTGVCPAIDGTLAVTSNGNGGWVGNVYEDKYPSRGLYWWNGASFQTVSQRSEGIFLDLMMTRREAEKFKIERDKAIPPGCELQ